MIPTVIDGDVDAARACNREILRGYVALPSYRNYWVDAGHRDEMAAVAAVRDVDDEFGVVGAMSDAERDPVDKVLDVAPALIPHERLDKLPKRETTDQTAIIARVAALGGAAVVRFVGFADGVTEDLDAFGTAFAVVVGLAILVAPFVVSWWEKRSRPVA